MSSEQPSEQRAPERNGSVDDLDDEPGESNGGGFVFRPASADHDDDDADERARLAPPPKPPRAAKPSTSRAPALPRKLVEQHAAQEFIAAQEDYQEALAALNVEPGQELKISIVRLLPKEDPETGVPLEGTCKTYVNEKPTPEQIGEEFGGGTYRAMIYGPKRELNGAIGLLTQKTIKIPGYPIIPVQRGRNRQRLQTGGGGAADTASVVERFAEAQEKSQEKLVEALKGGDGVTKELMPLLRSLLDPSRNEKSIAEERHLREEERKAERERREEERKAERAQREEERQMREAERKIELERLREERKHELAVMQARLEAERTQAKTDAEARVSAAEAQAKAAIAQAESQARAAIAQAEAQAKIQTEALKAQTATQEASMKLQIEAMRQQSETERKFLSEMSQTSMKLQNEHTQAMAKVSETQTQFLMHRLDVMEKSNGGIKGLLETKRALDELSGNDDDDDQEPVLLRAMEKAFDGIGRVAPGIFAAAGVRNSAKKQQPQAQAQVQANGSTEVEEGSVAVVDDAGQQRRRQLKRKRPQPQPQTIDSQVVASATKEEEKQAQAQAAQPNDLVDFIYPAGGKNAEFSIQIVELLVKNIDLAIRKNLKTPEIVEIVKRFPTSVTTYMRDMPIEQLIDTLDELEQITGWTITSVAGQEKVKAIHAALQSAEL